MSLIKVGQTNSESSVIEASTADKQPTYVNKIPEKTATDLTNSNLEDKTVVDLLLTTVTEKPEANAVVYGSHALTFRELDILSNQLAHYLRQRGVKEETMVPICMERSLEMIIGILGILKAGGAYVPIDPLYPPSRINVILEDIDATLLLTQQRLTSRLVGISSTIEVLEWETIRSITDVRSQPVNNPKPHHLAYVIFTSGSTGKPKGVLIEHAQLLNATQARTSYYKGLSNVLLVPSFSFDASVGAIFGSLTSGSCLYLCSQDDLQDTRKLQGILPRINTLLCVPSYYGFLMEEGLVETSKLSKVILGGEPLTEQLTSKHFSLDRNIDLYNEYGPTEATIWATVEKVTPGSHPVPIGLPIAGAEAYILDQNGNLSLENITGELHIGGKGLARGYLNDSDLTAEKFIDNPFDPSASRLYKTGDLCYRLTDGRIVFVGRVDEQVKINGHRIELGEIESSILRINGVRQVVVIAKDLEKEKKHLAAYIRVDKSLDKKNLREYLRRDLPDYMIPHVWVELDRFPLTPNGKVDRQALQNLPIERPTLDPDHKGPVDPGEKVLLKLWEKTLPEQHIGIHADFFELGGNSLMAMSLAAAIRRESRVDISVKEVFRHPTIAGLNQLIQSKSNTEFGTAIKPISPRPQAVPLSYGQESLWFIDQIGESLSYHLPLAFKIHGELDIEALTSSLRNLLLRHEVLRTVFGQEEDGKHQYLLPVDLWKLTQLQVERYDDQKRLQDKLKELIGVPFDLSKDLMLRATLIKVGRAENILLLVIHHIAFDAWSRDLLVKELWEGYKAYRNNLPPQLSPLPIQYADYALWQRAEFEQKSPEGKTNYWRNKLDGLVPLQLPKDFTPSRQDLEGAVKKFTIPKSLLDEIKGFSTQQGATLFMTLLAGFKVLLYRYSSQQDICVGTAIAGRDEPETEELIGYFINSLALRTHVDGQLPFLELLDRVKSTTLEAYEHKEVPFEKVVAEIGAERVKGQNPLFQVMFNLQNVPQHPLSEIENLEFTSVDVHPSHSKFDLTFSLTEDAEGIKGTVEFRTGLYRASTIEKMIGHYLQLLQSLIMDPSKEAGRLNMLSPEEREQLLFTFNQTAQPYPRDKTILDLLEEQVLKTPNASALLFGEQQITYKALDEKSNQLAHLLREKGIKEETLVLMCMQRSLEMVIGILGILKSGAAYVPIDPAYPKQRKQFIQEDTAAKFAVTDRQSQAELSLIEGLEPICLEHSGVNLQQFPSTKPGNALTPNHLAYVIYTSGSTGKPKGVMIEHRNVFSFICWCREEFSASKFDMVYAATSVCFDLSVFELFYPLGIGKPVRLLNDGLEIKQFLPEDSAVMLNTVPSVVGHLLEQKVDLAHVRVLNMAGEPLTKQILDGLDVEDIEVRNLYGPTEDTTYSTFHHIGKEKEILIGRPISNSSIYIVSPDNELNPVGVPGEIYIGGSGLARGYFNRPDLTDEKFLSNLFVPDTASRIYKTGDIGRWLHNGQIEYLGRKDDQVKIRGYRIELGEIERVLQQYEGIRQAVVLAKEDHKGNPQLVGYVVFDGDFQRKAIMDFLKEQLPAYMVPSLWVRVDKMPLTPNGKIDKKALPDTDPDLYLDKEYVAPRNQVEKDLAKIWQDLLQAEEVGIHDDFFQSGGHSLLATSFIAAVRKHFEVDLRIHDLFTFPTIAGLAENFDFKSKSSDLPPLQAIVPRPQHVPLSYNQESLWFIDQLSGSSHYHIPILLKLEGKLHKGALDQALRKIVERHEILRTVIVNGEEGPRQVVKAPSDWTLSVPDGENIGEDPQKLQDLINRTIHRSFDLKNDYMIRAMLIPIDLRNHLLVLVIHHIAIDGWSTSLLINELAALYRSFQEGEAPVLPPLPLQYADYALWQKKHLQGEFLKNKAKYWRGKLKDLPPLQLPLDYPRPAVQNHQGSVTTTELDGHLKEKLLHLSQQQGATLFMTLLTAFKVLLYRYSSQQDICVGTVTAGRQQKDTEELIGYFIHTLPVRSQVDAEASFHEVLREVKSNSLEAFENQEVPFDKIVADLNIKRDLSRNPLFQVMFVLQNLPDAENLDLGEVKIIQESVEQSTSKFDLSFIISEIPSGLRLSAEYCTKLFKRETIDRIVADYVDLLNLIATRPDGKIKDILAIDAEELYTPVYGSVDDGSQPATLPDQSSFLVEKASSKNSATTSKEKMIAKIWTEALGIEKIDVYDNFFEIGGHSLVAVQVMSLLEKKFGIKLPLSILFKHPTVKELALAIEHKGKKAKEWESLVPIKATGNKPPLYIIHGGGANILPFYSIAKNMDPDQPVYGLQPKGLNGKDTPLTSVEAIASHFIIELLRHNPDGPYSLAGYSFGGIVAFEMAKQLKALGKKVKHLIMFDTIAYQSDHLQSWNVRMANRFNYNIGKMWFDLTLLTRYPEIFFRVKKKSLQRKLLNLRTWLGMEKQKPLTGMMKTIQNIENSHREASKNYVLQPYDEPVYLLRAKKPTSYVADPKFLGWKSYVEDIRVKKMEGEHTTMFDPPNDVGFARTLQSILDQ